MSSVTTTVGNARNGLKTVRGAVPAGVWMALLLLAAILYPFIMSGNQDFLDASIQTLAYVIMALGLNIVVGFAGLLDLGYVAFYAIGAFVIGWFGSQQFPDVNGGKGIHILTPVKSAFGSALPRLHLNFFLVIFIAAGFPAVLGGLPRAPPRAPRGRH